MRNNMVGRTIGQILSLKLVLYKNGLTADGLPRNDILIAIPHHHRLRTIDIQFFRGAVKHSRLRLSTIAVIFIPMRTIAYLINLVA